MGDCHADPTECVHSAGETSSVVIVMRLGRRKRREPPLHARQRPKRVLPRLRRPRGGRPGAAGALGCDSRSRAAVRGAPELQRRRGGGGGARGCRPAHVAHRARDGLMDGGAAFVQLRGALASLRRALLCCSGVGMFLRWNSGRFLHLSSMHQLHKPSSIKMKCTRTYSTGMQQSRRREERRSSQKQHTCLSHPAPRAELASPTHLARSSTCTAGYAVLRHGGRSFPMCTSATPPGNDLACKRAS